jgi:hypothetical protein
MRMSKSGIKDGPLGCSSSSYCRSESEIEFVITISLRSPTNSSIQHTNEKLVRKEKSEASLAL